MALALFLLVLVLLFGPPLVILYIIFILIGMAWDKLFPPKPYNGYDPLPDPYEWGPGKQLIVSLLVLAALLVPQYFLYDHETLYGLAPWMNMLNGKDSWGN